jgi:hypothetical protein
VSNPDGTDRIQPLGGANQAVSDGSAFAFKDESTAGRKGHTDPLVEKERTSS